MAAQSDLQALLRFLSQDAKIPLSSAIAFVKPLQTANLASPAQIAASSLATLTPLCANGDEAKKIFNAAKRVSKRAATFDSNGGSPASHKKRKMSPTAERELDPQEQMQQLETSLALPKAVHDETKLSEVVLFTNRAPLLLAFTLVLLRVTMPKQPLSSQLSLAQAVVSEGARKKAVSLGIETGELAEDQGWGIGQPTINIMSRDIRVARRTGYSLVEVKKPDAVVDDKAQAGEQQVKSARDAISKIQGNECRNITQTETETEPETAYWALDLEALKKSNTTLVPNTNGFGGSGLPIYSPRSARAYLLKSFASAPTASGTTEDWKPGAKPKKLKSQTEEKEANLGMLLGALDLLFESWAKTLQHADLDRRAWGWYVAVRPEVEHGPSGWGGRGEVRLQRILDLRR